MQWMNAPFRIQQLKTVMTADKNPSLLLEGQKNHLEYIWSTFHVEMIPY